ncbi:MAG: hypothetical protein SAL70_40690 [Scytonema sp. PMC 1070.18]|nr:hypothetical protein [Scytonema sp. PMC 1070.18]
MGKAELQSDVQCDRSSYFANYVSCANQEVTIVESDKLPVQPHKRKGVPQSIQPHVLLVRG